MADPIYGQLLFGNERDMARALERWNAQPVDMTWDRSVSSPDERCETTLANRFSVTGSGTFFGAAQRTLTFEPTEERGWWFDREDLRGSLPIHVSVTNVWKTARNIVLCSGSPHNYMRMVEHIVALRVGLGLDNVIVRMNSGDPPLFERGSLDLVDGAAQAGTARIKRKPIHVTVRQPIGLLAPNGGFLIAHPASPGTRKLTIDCAIDFACAHGRQRIRLEVGPESFRYGALARTNCTRRQMFLIKTIGRLFADTRSLGYNQRNILIAGRRRYVNEPRLIHNGKSLEAVWHRATLDLLAAIALIDRGRFCGHIISYKAGHALDVRFVRELYRRHLLEEI